MGNTPPTRRRNRSQSSDDDKHDQHTDVHEIGLAGDSEITEGLNICTLPSTDPLLFFEKWYEEANECEGVKMVNSAALSTSSRSGRTSSRIVGVKGFDRTGFKIATNGNSLKAKNMEENPYASLLFYWECMGRMVRIDGRVVKLSDEEMNKIWKGFSRHAQILHTASHQDEVIKSSEVVLARKEELEQRYADRRIHIPRNPAWVAYVLIPEVWEFYQVGPDFMDRMVFRSPRPGETPDDVNVHQGLEGWVIECLSP